MACHGKMPRELQKREARKESKRKTTRTRKKKHSPFIAANCNLSR
jgi:hypothetical protein